MTIDEAKQILQAHGFNIAEEKRTGNDVGTQLRLHNGAIVNIWDKGSFNVQGKNKEAVESALRGPGTISPAGVQTFTQNQARTRVFVVYGHDTTARTQLEAMLRRWGLEPLILDQLPSEGQTIIEKLENYTGNVNFGVVLATPDDEGHRAAHDDEKTFRARQNVVLEMGMLLAKLGRPRVAVLIKNPQNMERPSDIQGIIYIPFSDNLEKEVGVTLAKEMVKQGFSIPIAKL